MKFLIIILIMFVVSLIPILYGDSYWGNLKVDIEKSERLEGDTSDVIRVKTEITNNDNQPITIYHSYVVLDDSKHREFLSSNYFDLRQKGFTITEIQCPWEYSVDLNPGILEDVTFCYEVPNENVEYTLHFYESYLEWCKNPLWGGCQEKTIRLVVNPPSPKSSSEQPKSSSTHVPKNIETNTNILRDITINFDSSLPGCEESNSCSTYPKTDHLVK